MENEHPSRHHADFKGSWVWNLGRSKALLTGLERGCLQLRVLTVHDFVWLHLSHFSLANSHRLWVPPHAMFTCVSG